MLTISFWITAIVTLTIVPLSQLAFASVSHCFFLPNIAINGGNFDEIKTNDLGSCCIACAQNSCCIAYTFDKTKNRCYLKAAITDSTKSALFTSGIKANVYSGRGSILKNIKINGGSPTTVKLSNNEECVQFCTAYGLSSFTSPAEGSNEPQGDCSCMSRISSLEYNFGSRSSIFPTDPRTPIDILVVRALKTCYSADLIFQF